MDRFIRAHESMYKIALKEIRAGKKQSHWMWFIFPQLKSLGRSDMAIHYGISDIEEAKEFLKNDYLRNNLIEISTALLELESNNAVAIFGRTDTMKLCSSMTLFFEADPENEVFKKVLDKFFCGIKDNKTIKLLREKTC